MTHHLVLATRNSKKLIELREILAHLSITLMSVEQFPEAPEVEETGSTFEENAALKAMEVARATGCWVLADDSGLEVKALHGRPGVCSARYSGPGATDLLNRKHLLNELSGIESSDRAARFVCVIALSSPNGGACELFRGEVEGLILEEERGESGFGYDPLFYIPALEKTMAEISSQQKNSISHRGRALALACARLEEICKDN